MPKSKNLLYKIGNTLVGIFLKPSVRPIVHMECLMSTAESLKMSNGVKDNQNKLAPKCE